MPDISPSLAVIVIAAGALAGGLGSLLGLGGGVFLVPFVNVVLGYPLNVASGVGLMTVVATSSVVARRTGRTGLVNLRLGMVLQTAAAIGAYFGASYARQIPEPVLHATFSAVSAVIAGIMLARLHRRDFTLDGSADPGPLGGRYREEASGRYVSYRMRRLPLALAVSLVAGSISGLLGLGGGILQVPALSAWCGVPIRAAAATSAVMIGITAAVSAPIYLVRGDVLPPLASAAVLGTLLGSRAGLWFGGRARTKWLELLMACVLALVAAIYLLEAL